MAIRAGKKIEFDAVKVAVTNDKAANKLIKREYRQGLGAVGPGVTRTQ